MRTSILNKYNYIGRDYDVYRTVKNSIRIANHSSVRHVTFIGMVISGLLTLTQIFNLYWDFDMNFLVYLIVFIPMLCIHLIANIQRKKEKQMIPDRVLIYMIYALVYGFTIYMGCYSHPDNSATAICVFVVALPLFFVDMPIRVNFIQIAATAAFIFTSYQVKDRYYARIDLLDGVAFLIVAIAVYYRMLYSKIREIESRELLRRERDSDPLTRILNRGGIEQYINEYTSAGHKRAALILLDVDNFKGINDRFGHNAGDDLLVETANIMQEIFCKEDVCGRLGGDEFVIFLPEVQSKEWLSKKLDELVNALDRTLIGDAGIQKISASIGVVLFPDDGNDFDQLYRNADAAMYYAKKNGKSSYVFYKAA